ncbi:FUSC family membrane protein [Roseivirga echinicomitans]
MAYDIQQFKSVLYGQYLAFGVKITAGIILPSLLFASLGDLPTGIILSLGAFYVSFADQPGPVTHRRNAMLVANLLIFIIAIISGVMAQFPWFAIIQIPLFCFVLGMLMVYGARASAVGMAALLMMVNSIYIEDAAINFMTNAALSVAGGLWYMTLSLTLNQIRPYRQAQHDLGECIIEIGDYLRLKAGFFNNKVSDRQLYQQLIRKQLKVNTHKDDVRQNILRTRKRVNDTMKSGRLVIMIFTDILALFEQAMSIQHDFKKLRKTYADHQVLPEYRNLIRKLAFELNDLGYALINNEKPKPLRSFDRDLEDIKVKLDAIEAQGVSAMALKKTIINIRNMTRLLGHIYNYFEAEELTFMSKTNENDLTKFISHQDFDWKVFFNNLSIRSTAFRYSTRLAVGCLLGYLISFWLPSGLHSHWILLTVLVILRPDFSLTKQRNYERIIGTLAGGLAGALILFLVQDEFVKLIFITCFMILTFSFNRIRYGIGVFFMTALVLILLSIMYGTSDLFHTTERVMYTMIGSALAFLVSYFVLPTWESSQIKPYLSVSLKANLTYLQQITADRLKVSFSDTSFLLARKDVYMEMAHLSAALQRILSEPKHKQVYTPTINEFVVLSHILSSYLASLSSHLEEKINRDLVDAVHLKLIRKTKVHLENAIAYIDNTPFSIDFELPEISANTDENHPEKLFIQKQLELIEKVSADIEKLSATLTEMP